MFSAKKIREIDNKLTYAVGYRNLYNIVVLAIGSVMLFTSSFNYAMLSTVGFIVFILGAHWFLEQMRQNIDAVYVSELD